MPSTILDPLVPLLPHPHYFARHHRGQSVKCASRRNESDESAKVGRIEALSTAHQEFRKAAVRWSRRRFRHHVERTEYRASC